MGSANSERGKFPSSPSLLSILSSSACAVSGAVSFDRVTPVGLVVGICEWHGFKVDRKNGAADEKSFESWINQHFLV